MGPSVDQTNEGSTSELIHSKEADQVGNAVAAAPPPTRWLSKKNKSAIAFGIFLLLILGGVGVGVYFYLTRSKGGVYSSETVAGGTPYVPGSNGTNDNQTNGTSH